MKTIVGLNEVRNLDQCSPSHPGEAWELSRPCNVDFKYVPLWALSWRLRAAWHVLMGRALPVRWI